MQKLTLQEKQQQYDEFFSIKHTIRLNLKPLAADFELPNVEKLSEAMPYAFKVASELASIDSKALRPLRNLGEHASELAEFLNHQSHKIDLMMSLILQQQDDPETAYETYKIGGGGVVVLSPDAYPVGELLELKLFLPELGAAAFCYGEVLACEKQDELYHLKVVFVCITEQDQDMMVKASLHVQTLSLRQRKQHANNE